MILNLIINWYNYFNHQIMKLFLNYIIYLYFIFNNIIWKNIRIFQAYNKNHSKIVK